MSRYTVCMRWTFSLVVAFALGCLPSEGDTSVVGEQEAARQLEVLRAENEALRRENQQLRRELVAKRAGEPGTALPIRVQDVTEKPQESKSPDTGFWLSSKSHIRHNSKCRSYRAVKGGPCGPKDGKPCKACGG